VVKTGVHWNAVQFAVKHAVAAAVVISGIIALTSVSYFALLVWAAAFPFMVLFALFGSVASVLFVLLPATALTEWICVKRRAHLLVQIPIATVLMAVCVLSAALVAATALESSVHRAASVAAAVFGALLVPLGVYWWSLQSAEWLIHSATRILAHMRR
jgi:hypothetical protein